MQFQSFASGACSWSTIWLRPNHFGARKMLLSIKIFRWILLYNAVWEMSTTSSVFQPTQGFFRIVWGRPARVDRNADKVVFIAHTALCNKIHLKIKTTGSIWRAPKRSGLNQLVDIRRRVCCIQIVILTACLTVHFDLYIHVGAVPCNWQYSC